MKAERMMDIHSQYPVIDVCRYIIEYCNKENYGVSNLKLQKMLYFAQKYFVKFCDRKLFEEPIEAWEFGPVIPAAYAEYKHFGAGEIVWDGKKGRISEKDATILEILVNFLSRYTETQLLRIVQKETPWGKNYVPMAKNRIPEEELKGDE